MENASDPNNAFRSYNSAHYVEDDNMDEIPLEEALHASYIPAKKRLLLDNRLWCNAAYDI